MYEYDTVSSSNSSPITVRAVCDVHDALHKQTVWKAVGNDGIAWKLCTECAETHKPCVKWRKLTSSFILQ